MLPHSVSQACSTRGEPTCSRHLSPDLLEGVGGTGRVKLGESRLDSSEKRAKRFLSEGWPLCLARMSTKLDSQWRPKTTRRAMGMFSHSSLLVSAHAAHHYQTPTQSCHTQLMNSAASLSRNFRDQGYWKMTQQKYYSLLHQFGLYDIHGARLIVSDECEAILHNRDRK